MFLFLCAYVCAFVCLCLMCKCMLVIFVCNLLVCLYLGACVCVFVCFVTGGYLFVCVCCP